MKRWRFGPCEWAVGALALTAVACGGHEAEAPKPTGRAIVSPSAAGTKARSGADQAPVVASVKLSPEVPVIGAEIKAVVEASDPDGDPIRLHYEWLRNGTAVAEGDQPLALLPELAKGDEVAVRVTATDGKLESPVAEASATVGDRPPVMTAVSLQPFGDVRPGKVMTADPQASDPDNDTLSFTYTWTVNGEEKGHDRTFDTHGLRRGDKVQVAVVASDGSAESRSVESAVQPMGNSPPLIKQLPAAQVTNGTFRYDFQAVDPDGDKNLRFFLAKGPAGMEIDPVTGVLTWKPDASQAGVHPVEVGVKDPTGDHTTFRFQMTVATKVTKPGAPPAAAAPSSEKEEE